jgi:hypothetical protein
LTGPPGAVKDLVAGAAMSFEVAGDNRRVTSIGPPTAVSIAAIGTLWVTDALRKGPPVMAGPKSQTALVGARWPRVRLQWPGAGRPRRHLAVRATWGRVA